MIRITTVSQCSSTSSPVKSSLPPTSTSSSSSPSPLISHSNLRTLFDSEIEYSRDDPNHARPGVSHANIPTLSSKNDPRRCQLCAQSDLHDYLMTCTRCGVTRHDACCYAQQRSDPRFAGLAGVRNCLDAKFWECPFCLWRRGVRDENWVKTGIFDDPSATTRTIKEKPLEMFSPQTGNIVVSHFSIREEAVGGGSVLTPVPTEMVSATPEEVECVMDLADPDLTAKGDDTTVVVGEAGRASANEANHEGSDGAVGAAEPLRVLNLSPSPSTVKCDVCASEFPNGDVLQSHVTSQHPMCGHCPQQTHFQDIPKILAHFQARHKNLKRCKVLIANETLTLAMNSSFHG